MRFIDPLEQFNLIIFFNSYFNYTCIYSNFTNIFLLISFVFIFFLSLTFFQQSFSWYIILIETFFNFIKNILKSNLLIKIQIFLPFLFFNFLFILISNLLGMIPYSFTATSHFSVTFFLSLTFFIGINIIGSLFNGILFINLFLPKNIPIFLTPLLFFLEIVSYFSRVFSLAIRLFANMMSGHALMKILAGFCWNFFSTFSFFSMLISILPFLIIFLIIGLEILIACLQAYVFLMLSTLYVNDVINIH